MPKLTIVQDDDGECYLGSITRISSSVSVEQSWRVKYVEDTFLSLVALAENPCSDCRFGPVAAKVSSTHKTPSFLAIYRSMAGPISTSNRGSNHGRWDASMHQISHTQYRYQQNGDPTLRSISKFCNLALSKLWRTSFPMVTTSQKECLEEARHLCQGVVSLRVAVSQRKP